jgi:uncharacterized protein YjbI with pentapeptide repeats
MKIVKPLTLGALTRSYRTGGERRFVISAIGFFPLGVAVERFAMESEQWAGALKALADEGIAQPLDEVLPKAHAELIVAGRAYAPEGKPVRQMQVTLAAAGIEKTLDVFGDRSWRYDPWLRVDEPKPFVSMPIGYAHAFGGKRHRGNPIGRGYERNRLAALFGRNSGPMPNVECPAHPVRRHWIRYAPAGFGPLAFDWETRARHAGRYGAKWLAHEAPGFSSSAGAELFQRAPADQWLAGYLCGGEPYRLTGMHPQEQVIEGTVPPFVARAFIHRSGAASIEPVALNFDTLWFFPGERLGVALYHGETHHEHPLAFDIEAVMVAYEHVERPRPFAHYADVYAHRTDPALAMAHLFNESELAADFGASTLAARTAATAEREAEAAAARAARREAQMAELQPAGGATPEPQSAQERREASARLTVPDRAAIAESDFDLGPTLAGAQALIAQARAQADALRAELPEPAAKRLALDSAARREAVLARAAEAADDLAQGGAATASGAGERSRRLLSFSQAKAPADAVKLDAVRAALAPQQRAARRARIRYTDPDGPLPPEVARWLGMQVVQWHRAGVLLAGRDLAGIDLSGADLSGADLREVQLENADLRNARFAGARLERAVLTGARLDGADFSRAVLSDANLSHSTGTGVSFAGADLSKAWALEAQWPAADLSDARLDGGLASGIGLAGARLNRVSAQRAVLLNAHASASDWRDAALSATVLMRADLTDATFAGATLRKTVLVDAKLARASFDAATLVDVVAGGREADWSNVRATGARAEHCSWQQTRLCGSDWRGATLLACDFGRADLTGARLEDSTMSGCLFTAATLTGARAERADLFRSVCRAADFNEASLAGASLFQADTSDATFLHADLRGVRWEPGRRVAA